MIRRILVPIDGSDSSQAALSIGCSLSGIARGRVLGLFVEDEARFRRLSLATAIADGLVGEPFTYEPLQPEELLAAEESVEREREALAAVFRERCEQSSVPGQFLARRGNPAQTIADAARGADLVVIGNSGRHSGVEGKEPGVTTNALLQKTRCPVLVVPTEAQGQSRMVIAYDGSPSAERMLRIAAEFASLTEMGSVHVITVTGDSVEAERHQQIASDYLAAYELSVTVKVLSGKPHEAIIRYCDEVDASIVALGAFGTNRLYDRIFGSTASHLLQSVDAAILLVS